MALQDLTMMLPSRLGCPLSLKTPNMGNTGLSPYNDTQIETRETLMWSRVIRTLYNLVIYEVMAVLLLGMGFINLSWDIANNLQGFTQPGYYSGSNTVLGVLATALGAL